MIMRRGLVGAAVAAMAVLSAAGAASAADLFTAFNTDCVQTHGDEKAALAAADAAGWIKVDGKAPMANPNFKLEDYGMRKSGPGADAASLAAGTGTVPMGGQPAPAKFCMLAGKLGEGDVAKAQAALGMAPMMTMNMPGAEQAKMNMYMFRDTPAGRVALTTAEMAAMGKPEANAKPALSMVMTMETAAHVGMLMYIVVNP